MLKQEEDFEKIYDETEEKKQVEDKEEPLPPWYESEKEYKFYGDDVNFLRFHKRTTENVFRVLQEIVDSSKQTISAGVKQNHTVTISHVELNRSVSVVNAWWSIAKLRDNSMFADEKLAMEAT